MDLLYKGYESQEKGSFKLSSPKKRQFWFQHLGLAKSTPIYQDFMGDKPTFH